MKKSKKDTTIDYPIQNDQELRDLIMELLDERLNGEFENSAKVELSTNKKGKKKSKKKKGKTILEETDF